MSVFSITVFVHVDYIDEVFGDKSLWPSQPNPKAQLRILVTDFGDKVAMSGHTKLNQDPKQSEIAGV